MTYFAQITWGIFWIGWAIWGYITRRRVHVQQRSKTNWYRRIHVALVVLSFILLLNPLPMSVNKPVPGLPHWVHLLGMGLMLMGLLLGAWARQVLADNWSDAIVYGFPLGRVRYDPVSTQPVNLMGLMILCGTYAVKISREEQFLRQVLPGYSAYSQHTWRLIPFLY